MKTQGKFVSSGVFHRGVELCLMCLRFEVIHGNSCDPQHFYNRLRLFISFRYDFADHLYFKHYQGRSESLCL